MSLDPPHLPSYQGDGPAKGDCLSDIRGNIAENPNVSYHTWGIFTIAYASCYIVPSLPDFGAYHGPLQASYRLLNDLWRLDRCCTLLLILCGLCIAIAPAFSLYFIHRVTLYVSIKVTYSSLQIYDAAVGCAVRIQPDNTRPCHEGSPDDGFQLGAIGSSILWTRDRHVSNFLKLNMLSSIVLSGLKRKYVPGVA